MQPSPVVAVRLTDRQVEILGLMAEGLADKAIAARLCVSVRCVRLHVAAACRRLHCNSRSQLMVRALTLGFIRADPVEFTDSRAAFSRVT